MDNGVKTFLTRHGYEKGGRLRLDKRQQRSSID